MFELRQTAIFENWFLALKDRRAREIIAKRLVRIEAGLLGDAKSVGKNIREFRINYGPGYRLYYTMRRDVIIILLCGGDKKSQSRDIRRAQKLEQEIPHEIDEI